MNYVDRLTNHSIPQVKGLLKLSKALSFGIS